jgi:hypothetical protein
MSDRAQEILAWLLRAAPPAWRATYRYEGVSLESMPRDALIGLIYVQSQKLAKRERILEAAE